MRVRVRSRGTGRGAVTVARGLASTLAGLGCFAAATGCYSYQPIAPASAAPGSTVRTRLSAQGMVRLEPLFGEPPRTVMGEVVQAGGDELLLLTRTPLQAGTFEMDERLRQRVAIPHQEILEAEVRLLDRGRTAGVTGLVTAGAVALVVYFLRGESRGRTPGTPDPGDPS